MAKPFRHKLMKYGRTSVVGFVLILLSIIPIRLAIASYQAPYPEAILVLGGDAKREEIAAQLAKYYPDYNIWISGGQLPRQAQATFQAAGIAKNRLHLDYRATDTVTNFTTLIPDFKQYHIQHLYIVTSDFHMPRARAIATIVLGSQGILFTPVSTPSNQPREPILDTVRDVGRSLLWIFTGYTGASLKAEFASNLLISNLLISGNYPYMISDRYEATPEIS